MNLIRTNHGFRSVLILAMMLGWVMFSQRCALGQILRTAQAQAVQHQCCSKDRQEPVNAPVGSSGGAECCHALSVLIPDEAKLPITPVLESIKLPLEWLEIEVALQPAESPKFFDTGPPHESRAFVELVLHRSLRSHAPPFLA